MRTLFTNFKGMMLLAFACSIITTKAFSRPPEYSGAGLLKPEWRGKLSLDKAKDVLDMLVVFSDEDQQKLKKYLRETPGFSAEKARVLIMQKLTQLDGKNPATDSISAQRALDIIDALQLKMVRYADWKNSGFRSVFVLTDGTGKVGAWIPDRGTGNILSFGEKYGFDLFCLNPIIAGATSEVVPPVTGLPDLERVVVTTTPTAGGVVVNVTNNITATSNGNQNTNVGGGSIPTDEVIPEENPEVIPRQYPRYAPRSYYGGQQYFPQRRPLIRVNVGFGNGTGYGYRPVQSGYHYNPPHYNPPTQQPIRYNNSRPGRHQ